MIVVGGGPIGAEISQAYQRLGCQVTVVADRLLPKEDPDVRQLLQEVSNEKGVGFVWGRATSCAQRGRSDRVSTGARKREVRFLLIASGRRTRIWRDSTLRNGCCATRKEASRSTISYETTAARHIYAVGDVVGGYRFSHFAGWQTFQAVRNALLPGSSSGLTDLVPSDLPFTDPEVCARRTDRGAGTFSIWSGDNSFPMGFEPGGSSRL